MTLPPRDIDFLPCHFAAEATVRGNGPNTRNFGDPLDANAFGPAVEALIDEGKWPFRLSFAINNAVLRSGNVCGLLRSDTPDYLASLCIHTTSRSIGAANRPMDTNMEPYGGELMLTIQSVEIDTDESDSSSEDDQSDSSSENLHMPELEYVVNDGNGQSTHASPQ